MRYFQTFILPDEEVAQLGLSFAAANFSRNLISGNGFDKVYSLIPVNVNSKLSDVKGSNYEIVYSKWRTKKSFLRKVSIFLEQFYIYSKIKRNDSIWFYNLNMLNGFLYILLKLFKPSVKRNIIILDFTPPENWKEQNYWFLKLINTANGAISLSPYSFCKIKNIHILPGVVPNVDIIYPKITIPNKEFLLSGVISESISMTHRVLEAFSRLPSCKLYITGKVLEGEDLIREYSDRFENIIYLGSIPFSKYIDLLHHVTFQLSMRNPTMPENQCNFPSKIIEALLHNRIVISSLSYPQLKDIRYLTIDATDLFNEFSRISMISDEKILSFANEATKVKKLFNVDVWNQTMSEIELNEE